MVAACVRRSLAGLARTPSNPAREPETRPESAGANSAGKGAYSTSEVVPVPVGAACSRFLGRDRSRLRPQVSEGLLRAIGLSGYQGALVDPAGLALGVGPIEELGTLWLGRAGDRWVRWAPGEPGGLVGQTDPDSRTFGTPRVRPAGRSPTRREALEGTRGHDKEPCNELTRIVARVVVQFTGKIEPMEQTLRPILPGASQAPSGWQINLSSGKGGPELRSGRTDLGGSR